jgi:hypothetical protein
MAIPANRFDRRTLYKLVRGGALACVVPLSFDAIMSLLSHHMGSYAPPFLYLIFFVLGAVFAFEALRRRGHGDGDK